MLEAARQVYDTDQIRPEVLQTIEPGNDYLQEIVDRFHRSRGEVHKISIACFYELKATNVGNIVGGKDRMVR